MAASGIDLKTATRPFLLLLLLLCFPIGELSANSGSVGFAEAVDRALASNAELQAAKFAIHQARGRLIQAGRWSDPRIRLEGMSDFVFSPGNQYAFTAGIAQRFPVTARLGLERDLEMLHVLRALREVRNEERLLIGEVQTTYVEVVAAGERARALGTVLQSARATKDLAEKRLQTGQGSLTESGLALVDERTIWNQQQAERIRYQNRLGKLKTLMGFSHDTAVSLSDGLDEIISSLQPRLTDRPRLLNRPDLEILMLAREEAAVAVRLAKAEIWDGFDLEVAYTRDRGVDEPEGLGDDHFLGLSVSIPLPLWDRNQGRIEEGRAAEAQAVVGLAAARLRVENELAGALREASLLRERAEGFRAETLGPVDLVEEEMRRGHLEGRIDFRDLLAVRRQRAGLRLDAVTARARWAEALVAVETISGSHPRIKTPYAVPLDEAPPRTRRRLPAALDPKP